jgi:hypothetical protein
MSLTDAKVTWIGAAVALLIGAAVGALGMKACTAEPKTETITTVRTDTIPGPGDTSVVEIRVPVRVPYAVAITDSGDVRALQAFIESILTDYDALQARYDTLAGLVATTVTRTPDAELTAHLDMAEFRREPRRGLYATAVVTSRDTSRTTVHESPASFWGAFGWGVQAGAGFNLISRTPDVQVGVGVQLQLDELF